MELQNTEVKKVSKVHIILAILSKICSISETDSFASERNIL